MKPILSVSYSGPAYELSQAFYKGEWERSPESERITGSFRLVEQDGDDWIVGNGEGREKFWLIKWDQLEDAMEAAA